MAKAAKIEGVSPEKPLEECARRIVVTRMDEMMSFKEGSIAGEDIEFVHDIRVASRRLRAAMRNFSKCFPKKKYKKRLRAVETITSTVGGVRDMDVLIDRFERDLASLNEADHAGVVRLIDQLKARREKARRPMIAMFERLDSTKFEKKFRRFFKA